MKRFQKRTGALNGIRFLTVCFLLLALAMPSVCAEEIPELLEPVGVKMDTAEAYIGEISRIEVFDGNVAPYVEGLYFSTEGIVDEVHVVIGQEVRKGDVLVTMDQEAQQEQIDSLENEIGELREMASFEEQLADIDRDILKVELQALMDSRERDENAVQLKKLEMEEFELNRQLEVDMRNLEIRRLEGELALIHEQMGEKVLTAPFDGRVMLLTDIGKSSHVGAYAPVLYLADESRLTIETQLISQHTIGNASALYALIGADRYEIEQIRMDEQEYMSKVLAGETIMSEFSVVDMDEDVTAGMYAAVCAEMDYVADALLIPGNALYSDASGDYVYLMEDGVRVRRDVKTGVETEWLVQILEGIEEGDVVYVKE